MKKKTYLLNFALFLSSVVVCIIIIEVAWRTIIFGDFGILESQKKAELYADPYSEDDYWKLKYLFRKKIIDKQKKQEKNEDRPERDNKLFTRLVLRDSYKHINLKYVNGRRSVLLYGDSFAACYMEDGCFDHILNNDTPFSKNHYLLNYGVGGYGLDQIYFLFKNSIDNYKKPFVVISLMTLDLDRSALTVRDVPKTYFTIENDMLILHERPSPFHDREAYNEKNKPQILSYFYRRVLYSSALKKLMPDWLISYLKKEKYYTQKKIRLNEKILLAIIKELKSRDLDYVFLIFHPIKVAGVGALDEDVSDWRNPFIRNILEEQNAPYIWSRDIILQNMKAEGLTLDDYFIPNDGHPTIHQKELLVNRIKEYVFYSEPLTDAKN